MIQTFIHNDHAILINIYRIYNINHGIINLNEKHRLALIPLLGNPEIIATQLRSGKIKSLLISFPRIRVLRLIQKMDMRLTC